MTLRIGSRIYLYHKKVGHIYSTKIETKGSSERKTETKRRNIYKTINRTKRPGGPRHQTTVIKIIFRIQ